MKLTSSCLSSSMKYIYCYYSGAIDLNKSNASMFSDDEGEITDSSSDEDVRYNYIFSVYVINICYFCKFTQFFYSLHDISKSVVEELNVDRSFLKRQSDSE